MRRLATARRYRWVGDMGYTRFAERNKKIYNLYMVGATYAEIASILNLSRGSVQSGMRTHLRQNPKDLGRTWQQQKDRRSLAWSRYKRQMPGHVVPDRLNPIYKKFEAQYQNERQQANDRFYVETRPDGVKVYRAGYAFGYIEELDTKIEMEEPT